jgi:hypothetical protein
MPVAGSAAPGPVERDFDTRVRVQRAEHHAATAAEPAAAERLGQRVAGAQQGRRLQRQREPFDQRVSAGASTRTPSDISAEKNHLWPVTA